MLEKNVHIFLSLLEFLPKVSNPKSPRMTESPRNAMTCDGLCFQDELE